MKMQGLLMVPWALEQTPLQASFNYSENEALRTAATLAHEPTRNMDPAQHHASEL